MFKVKILLGKGSNFLKLKIKTLKFLFAKFTCRFFHSWKILTMKNVKSFLWEMCRYLYLKKKLLKNIFEYVCIWCTVRKSSGLWKRIFYFWLQKESFLEILFCFVWKTQGNSYFLHWNFDWKSCFVVCFHKWNEWKNPQFNFSSQDLSIERNYFKWDGKVTKILHLLFYRIRKNLLYYFGNAIINNDLYLIWNITN